MKLDERIGKADSIFTNAKIRAHDGHREMRKLHQRFQYHFHLAWVAWIGVALLTQVASPIVVGLFAISAAFLTITLHDAANSAEASCFTAGYLEGQFREIRLLNDAMRRALHSESERGDTAK